MGRMHAPGYAFFPFFKVFIVVQNFGINIISNMCLRNPNHVALLNLW